MYTEEHEELLGSTERSWELFVDGCGKDGKRIYDSFQGKTCHQCRCGSIPLFYFFILVFSLVGHLDANHINLVGYERIAVICWCIGLMMKLGIGISFICWCIGSMMKIGNIM